MQELTIRSRSDCKDKMSNLDAGRLVDDSEPKASSRASSPAPGMIPLVGVTGLPKTSLQQVSTGRQSKSSACNATNMRQCMDVFSKAQYQSSNMRRAEKCNFGDSAATPLK